MECDILLGAETNLKNKDPEDMCEISSQEHSFSFKRFNNNKERLGRGLIVYCKQEFEVIDSFEFRNGNSVLEMMAIKTTAMESELTIINVYKSPHYPFHSLKKNLDEILTSYSNCRNVLLLGDFNEEKNVLSGSNYTQIIKTSSTSGLFGGQLCHACQITFSQVLFYSDVLPEESTILF